MTLRKFSVVMRTMWRSASGKFALITLAVWVLVSLIAVLWTPQSLWTTDGYHAWAGSSAAHWLGTDGVGADVLSWLMAGSGTDLVIVAATVLCSAAIGVLCIVLLIARNSAISSVSLVLTDAFISIPTVLIALILAVPFGASIAGIVVACSLGYGLNLGRIARPQALLVARSDYVQSAVSSGASAFRIVFTHILPNIVPLMLVQLSLSAGTAVLAESGLTYLGIGVPSGIPSWGHSLATSASFINVHPYAVLWPGLVVTLAVIALNLFGDALRDAVDPTVNVDLRHIDEVSA